MTHCRGPEDADSRGGDDDRYNVWYFEVDPSVVVPDGTPLADYWIHILDGHCVPVSTGSGVEDTRGPSVNRTAFEFRLYGGSGAAALEEVAAGTSHGSTWGGQLIDIDPDDPSELTLRTDDADDIDGNDPEDLRNGPNGFSRIGIDMDANPGDVIGGRHIYKLVVDARSTIGGPGGINRGDDWNRYKLIATRDSGRTNALGIQLMTYEMTYAGRPSASATNANLAFFVPATADSLVDLQTLDMDQGLWGGIPTTIVSRLSTFNRLYPDNETFESGQQFAGGQFRWSSVFQGMPVPSVASGNGQRGFTISTVGEAGAIWVYDIDPVHGDNPFSVRLKSSQSSGADWLPIRVVSTFTAYGDGQLGHYGAGTPRSQPGIVNRCTLYAEFAPPTSAGFILISTNSTSSVLNVPPWSIPLYVGAGSISTVGFQFDSAGRWQHEALIPVGIPPGSFYSQVFGFDQVQARPLYSNGLKTTLIR